MNETAKDPSPERIVALPDPLTGLPLAASGARARIATAAGGAAVSLNLGYPLADDGVAALRDTVANLLAPTPLASFEISQRIAAHATQPNVALSPRVRNIIAIGSGKGGVGKSTTAVNLALALAADGARVGVLDADVYGPSIPTMLGLSGRPDSPDGKSIVPMRAHGIEAMSIGLLVEQDTPMIWRGPMATSALTQLLEQTLWGGEAGLDYLIVDLPPGTGDIQLTLAQKIPVAGAVIVTTPQDVATLDARKALKMFEKVQVPVLGLVENMAVHTCGNCGHVEHVFGEGGAARMSAQYGLPLLGSLPLELSIREQGDAGVPVVASAPGSAAARAYRAAARSLAMHLAARPRAAMPIAASMV
ncbi:MAG: iron-sulfur cluster carrier protein ApbC [Pseudomonadota bacterium]|nr:iron-sulfur cluster carrier protein ApbC [Pseudomonadota bacterium]